ncbi:MAG: matrixin family metalloprotease [Proteobacteria bacterium]|nr:matrixin family metalloprotease [Pseudomonadota bacterium]MCP4915686.1 matrixin family metalloprotease [Pseudomonadota bacterium]
MSLLLLASISGDAQAYNHTGWIWTNDQMPIVFYVSEYMEDSLPDDENPQTGWTFQEEVQIKNLCNWKWTDYCESLAPGAAGGIDARFIPHEDAACADIQFEYGGAPPGGANSNNPEDAYTNVYFDDPSDEHGTGTNAVTITRASTELITNINGVRIYKVKGSDIVYNDNIDWSPDWEIEDGCQGDERSMEATGTHEFGHLLGMAHSCEQGELCVETEELEATMYWTGPSCDTERSAIGEDDRQGIQALYGPAVGWDITEETERFGAAPLEACFEISAEEEVMAELEGLDWDFGDGNSSTEEEPCHTYQTEGQFTVTLDATGVSESCGDWISTSRQRALFLVCDTPRPDFSVEHYDGLTYQLVNQTDVSTYGCVDGIKWEIYKGNSASGDALETVEAWSPKFEFPSDGDYTIVLTAQGPAGEDVFELKHTAEEHRGDGKSRCSTAPGKAAIPAGLLALFGLAFVRRRD